METDEFFTIKEKDLLFSLYRKTKSCSKIKASPKNKKLNSWLVSKKVFHT